MTSTSTSPSFASTRPAPSPPASGADWLDRALQAFAAGHLDEVEQLLDQTVPPDHRVAALLRADIGNRRLRVSLPGLVTLQERIEPSGDPTLQAWAAAITAERLAIDGDPSSYAIALSTLARLRADGPPDPLLDYTRARLLRLAALASLLLPTPTVLDHHHQAHDECLALFRRHGFTLEARVADGLAAGARVLLHGEDPDADYRHLLATRALVDDDPTSLWPMMLDVMVGNAALCLADADVATTTFDRIERALLFHPRLSYLTVFGRALFRFRAEGPTDEVVAALHRALDHCKADPRWRYGALAHTASLLLDVGSPAGPDLAETVLEMPPNGPVDALERDLLAGRVSVRRGQPPADEALLGPLEQLETWGRPRRAARGALRLAHDVVGTRPAIAGQLHRWALARLPAPGRSTEEERLLRRPLGSPHPIAATSPGTARVRVAPLLEVSVLGPGVDVRVHGVPITLARMEALLLVHLVLRHPDTVHVEVLHDALWPERPFVRRRLNTLVHRLRTALGPGADAIRRTRDLIGLDEVRCQADLTRYQAALAAPDDETRADAIASVTSNLCAASYPFEDRLIVERDRFAGEWLEHARSLVRAGAIEPHRLYRARAALDLLDLALDR